MIGVMVVSILSISCLNSETGSQASPKPYMFPSEIDMPPFEVDELILISLLTNNDLDCFALS